MLDIMVGDAPSAAAGIKFSQSTYGASVLENSRVGTKVMDVRALWSDGRSTRLYYSIAAGNDAGVFEMDKSSGKISFFCYRSSFDNYVEFSIY